MTEHWDGNNLPGIISWLVDLHGESSMRGVLGIYYQGLRTGALQLASVDTVVAQTVIDLVEAAVAAGEALPRPPEPVAPLSLPLIPWVAAALKTCRLTGPAVPLPRHRRFRQRYLTTPTTGG